VGGAQVKRTKTLRVSAAAVLGVLTTGDLTELEAEADFGDVLEGMRQAARRRLGVRPAGPPRGPAPTPRGHNPGDTVSWDVDACQPWSIMKLVTPLLIFDAPDGEHRDHREAEAHEVR
jgi:hypothetical protein